MKHTVIGVYDNYTQAQEALNELVRSGFAIEHVNLSPQENSIAARQAVLQRHADEDGSTTGTISGFFRSLFGSPEKYRHEDVYSEAVRRGSYLVTVHTDTEQQNEQATDIMNRYEPVDIDERAEQWQSQGWSGYDASAPALSDAEIEQERNRYTSGRVAGSAESSQSMQNLQRTAQSTQGVQSSRLQESTAEGKTTIPVVQEELHVGKREVQRGGVRVLQHVVETPVQEQVHLREEHVSVERHQVNEPATEADMATLKDSSFEMRETAEEPVVAKTARVVEEVVVGKNVTEHTETIKDTVRHTDVEVEKMGGQALSAAERGATAMDDSDFRKHWQTTYGQSGGRYEDYAPAYQHGLRMASDERYSKYRWSDVEPDVRQDWETRNASQPWDRFKDAIRYGWDKATH